MIDSEGGKRFFSAKKVRGLGKSFDILLHPESRTRTVSPPLSPLLFLSRKIPRKRIGKDEEEEEGKRLGKRLLLFLPPPFHEPIGKGKGTEG